MKKRQHYARQITYDELRTGLEDAHKQRIVNGRDGPNGLRLYNYSNSCVFDRAWTPFSLIARGLILDTVNETIVATPFPKFFNLGEMGLEMPDEPFEIFEKLDGSLIIIYFHNGEWQTATRGNFDSHQAIWAKQQLANYDLSELTPGTTYLAEAIFPENRIVISYDEQGLVMLGAFCTDGYELDYAAIKKTAEAVGWRAAERYHFDNVDQLLAHAKALPVSEEGYVLLFESGERLKLKGDEYRRVHALISRVTPLGIWELMFAQDDLQAVRKMIPEELWWDFDEIVGILEQALNDRLEAIDKAANQTAHLSDKGLGLKLQEFPREVGKFLFSYRKYGSIMNNEKNRDAIMRSIRPTGNELDGYNPSFTMSRIQDEEG